MTAIILATQHLTRNGGVGVHVLRAADALRVAGHSVELVAGRVDAELAAEGTHELPGLEARSVPAAVLHEVEALAGGLPRPVVTHIHHLWDIELVRRLQRAGPVLWHVHEFAGCPTGEYHFKPGHECHRAHGPGCFPNIAFRGCAHTWDLRSIPRRYRRTADNIRIMRAADGVVAYSRFVAGHVRRNGINQVRVAPLIVPTVPGWSQPPGTNRVLFAGRLAPNKGLQTLLAAARGLEAEVDVVGSGWWQADAERIAGKLGVADRVRFHGWQPAEVVDRLYSETNVVAVPSLWPEPFGLVGPEAMAHGRPVVGSDTGGIPEWLDHDRTGFLVPAGEAGPLREAIERLLADPGLCRRFGEAGAERAGERYSPAMHAAAMAELHAELLEGLSRSA